MHAKTIRKNRIIRRNRAKIFGSAKMPRLAVFRSNKNLSLQLIDDGAGRTLLALSTASLPDIKKDNKTKQAETLGIALAKAAAEKGIKQAVFDRRNYKYHGRVRALAESAKSNGLKI